MTDAVFARLSPKRRDAIDRIWSALRVLQRDVDIRELAMTAGAPESSTGDYVRLLVRADYVRVISYANGRRGALTKYRLVRNSGAKAPRRAISVIFDANDGATYPLPHRHTPRGKISLRFEGIAA